jgi:hypothetical protein
LQAEEVFGKRSPWNDISKLVLINSKSRSDNSRMSSLLALINDLLLNTCCQATDLSFQNLKGTKTSNKGLIDCLLFKLDLLSHFFTKVLAGVLLLPPQEVQILVETLSSVSTYRKKTGKPTIERGVHVLEPAVKDFSWRIGLSHVGDSAFKFLEAWLNESFC